MRRRSMSKTSQKAMGIADNVIAATVCLVVTSLILAELFRFVQRAISR
jgi:hypothetical protein